MKLFKNPHQKFLSCSYFQDPRVQDALGTPIKGYGEETTRRRRTHVNHAIYVKDGSQHMRMKFYIQGVRNKGVVELDMKMVRSIFNQNSSLKFDLYCSESLCYS